MLYHQEQNFELSTANYNNVKNYHILFVGFLWSVCVTRKFYHSVQKFRRHLIQQHLCHITFGKLVRVLLYGTLKQLRMENTWKIGGLQFKKQKLFQQDEHSQYALVYQCTSNLPTRSTSLLSQKNWPEESTPLYLHALSQIQTTWTSFLSHKLSAIIRTSSTIQTLKIASPRIEVIVNAIALFKYLIKNDVYRQLIHDDENRGFPCNLEHKPREIWA